MPKRQPNKIYPVVETIDRAAADAIFAIYKMPNENSQMAFGQKQAFELINELLRLR